MIFYILDTLSSNDSAFVENRLKALGKEDDYVICRCSSEKLKSLDIGGRVSLTIGGQLQGVIFYEE